MKTIEEQIGDLQATVKKLVVHAQGVQEFVKEKYTAKIASLEATLESQSQEISELRSQSRSGNQSTTDESESDLNTVARATFSNEFDYITCKGIVISDGKKNSKIGLGIFGGQAGLSFSDTAGKLRLFITLTAKQEPIVNFYDANGKSRIAAGIRSDEMAFVALTDTNGQDRVISTTHPDGTVVLPTKDLIQE